MAKSAGKLTFIPEVKTVSIIVAEEAYPSDSTIAKANVGSGSLRFLFSQLPTVA